MAHTLLVHLCCCRTGTRKWLGRATPSTNGTPSCLLRRCQVSLLLIPMLFHSLSLPILFFLTPLYLSLHLSLFRLLMMLLPIFVLGFFWLTSITFSYSAEALSLSFASWLLSNMITLSSYLMTFFLSFFINYYYWLWNSHTYLQFPPLEKNFYKQ